MRKVKSWLLALGLCLYSLSVFTCGTLSASFSPTTSIITSMSVPQAAARGLPSEGVNASSGWTTETVDSGRGVGMWASIALDNNGYPHISYFDNSNGTTKYARWTGSSWSIQTVDSVGEWGAYTSITLDSSGNPHISYHDELHGDLKYARWTGSSWSTQTVDSAGWVGWYTSMALDSSGNPHISYYYRTSYYNYNIALKYARWTGSVWEIQAVDNAGNVGVYTSIALDKNGYPHISYYDDNDYNLKYARWTGSSWSIQTVDSAGYVGGWTSIALDSSGNPHISYHDFTNGDLKYARWTGTSWSIQTVDSAGYVGEYTSIALDSSGNPHISYRDLTNNGLKYARGILISENIPPSDNENISASTGIPASTGGTVTYNFPEFGFTLDILEIPPDSLSENTTITVEEKSVDAPSGYAKVSQVYDIGPDNTTFSTPSTLTLPYNENEIPSGVSEEDLAIYRHTGDNWERLGGAVDTSANTVSVQVDHLSEYAVMAQLPPRPPVASQLPWIIIAAAGALVAVLIAAIGGYLSVRGRRVQER